MKKLIIINNCIYLLSIIAFIENKILSSNHTLIGDHFYRFKSLFNEKPLLSENSSVLNRKIRSNSHINYESNNFETKKSFVQSFIEIPMSGVESDSKSKVKRQTNSAQSLLHFPNPDNLFAPMADINRLKNGMEYLFSMTRNSISDMSAKVKVQKAIINFFKANNLLTSTQKFSPNAGDSTQVMNGIQGLNIIGIIPGIHRSGTKVLLIGAHYDTVDQTSGVNDNGSGMSALLEIIRLINVNNCRLTYTLMFVALDLEEYGALGSKYFVNEYLIPNELMARKSEFEGAIILDTILNFNQTVDSQDIPYDVHRTLPHWSREIRENGFVGDFLALISRNNIDHRIANHIKNIWNSMSKRTPYRISELKINSLNSKIPDFDTLSNHANLLRSDHVMFWYHNHSLYNDTLKAVLLTDTGPFRGYMRDCYHTLCDNTTHLNEQNLRFLRLTVEVLTRTAVDLTLGKCSAI